MPIIAHVGSKSLKVRLVFMVMFTILTIGAATMIYPFLLMMSGSVKSGADFHRVNIVPRYLYDDDALWPKYVESKYRLELSATQWLSRPIDSWRTLQPPPISPEQRELAQLFIRFREEGDWPDHWFNLGHVEFRTMLTKNSRIYRQQAQERYDNDILAFSNAVGVRYSTWSQIGAPIVGLTTRFFTYPDSADFKLFDELKAKAPRADWIPSDLDAAFWYDYLRNKWAKLEDYNRAHKTSHADYHDVVLTARPPADTDSQAHKDWEEYVRVFLNPAFIKLDPEATPHFQRYLKQKAFAAGIDELNLVWGSQYATFTDIQAPGYLDASQAVRNTLGEFIKNRAYCPLSVLSVQGPRQAFEQFVAEQRGVAVSEVTPLRLPIEAVDYLDMQANTRDLRWEFFTRNYKSVVDYILLHGNGVRNTIIFCGLLVGATLLVNPLAAYALSRYKPPTTYTILLFCMCTMAFPGEVTMIPSFLLLKRFPFYQMMVGLGAMIVIVTVLYKVWPRGSEWAKVMIGFILGVLAGWWVAPQIAMQVFGARDEYVSLLNTFWALILPGMANGYSIFLLKGFFDSLPRDLYEAADIDGAGEWTKFWGITMSLSKPILAVIALAAFTVAYSEFLMALVIIPDQDMWTIMVWLFQLQSYSHSTVVYASLVIAAIPTLLIFLFCQNIIMRGIVVPVEK